MMQLDQQAGGRSPPPRFALPTRCPHCGDWLVAPVASEFVEGGEIRHHWTCESCSHHSLTSVSVVATCKH
ncbi:MAG TPA: hypothetical protein VFS63_11985 [Pseudolabrys sp.]|jgi:hypothetical protein|nr:hypothetical protein [Pseudolabrys sp.]HVU19728.1 hypothetical protein [Rhizomicrobium sp.]